MKNNNNILCGLLVFLKMHLIRLFTILAGLVMLFVTVNAIATETENRSIRVLPAPGKVTIDGKTDDWDLSGGIFTCGDVENMRDRYAVWLYAMYDAENIYLLARWIDPTPINNPEKAGGHGWNGDCLQVRFVLFPDKPERTVTWWTMWRDSLGASVADRAWPGPNNGVNTNELPYLARAEEAGFHQAFAVTPDKKGYFQEIVIPWKLLSVSGKAPAAGEHFRMTVEPNFTAGAFGRITIKGLLDGNPPNRVFTFRHYNDWGRAVLEAKGKVETQSVRLADDRNFKTATTSAGPEIDWDGLIQKFEWPGFEKISFNMPFDGYVSLNILDSQGCVVRHLLNWDRRQAGKYEVKWDGLTDATYRTPGTVVPAGTYTWKAIAHPGATLTFRGYASYGGRVPWDSGPKDFWLGDHGVPSAVVTDDQRMYLACTGAEGGRHLLATDFDGRVIWALQNTTGASDPEYIAVADDTVYVLHPRWWASPHSGKISRINAANGAYRLWPGTKSAVLDIASLWPDKTPDTTHFNGITAKPGFLYLSNGSPEFNPSSIADWKAMVGKLLDNSSLSNRILNAFTDDPRVQDPKKLKAFIDGKIPQEKAFATWLGGPRFDTGLIKALNIILTEPDLIPEGSKLSGPALKLANRRFFEKALAPAIQICSEGTVYELNTATGKITRSWPVTLAGPLFAAPNGLIYVISGGTKVLAINPDDNKVMPVIDNLKNAKGITVDSSGKLYVSVDSPYMQVIVFDDKGRELKRIGRTGGRTRTGTWQADGMLNPAGLAVDKSGQLWVMEHDHYPKRVSIWQVSNGAFVKDFFGITHYGASGGAINPRDPNLMVGEGCEWRLDPATGKSVCLGTFYAGFHSFSTFREGKNGRLYLFARAGAIYHRGPLQVWERLGDGKYALRAELRNDVEPRWAKPGATELWIDLNGDGERQSDETQRVDGVLTMTGANGWSLALGPDMAMYVVDHNDGKLKRMSLQGFADSGAPRYDLLHLESLPESYANGPCDRETCAVPSVDNQTILLNVQETGHPAGHFWKCYELKTGKLLWTYPNPFYQVHGSHRAPAPEPGLFRGAFGIIGAVSTKETGPFWIINGNLGEWSALTSDGFYLTRLFCGNIFEWKWPADATPGFDMMGLPPGCGGEDFGGSVTQTDNGGIYIQAGKTAIWNVLLGGLDKAVHIPGGELTISDADTKQAALLREEDLQAAVGTQMLAVKKKKIEFTGDLNRDFRGAQILRFQKTEDAKVRCAMAWDDINLYVGWEVSDTTPWMNGGGDIAQIYATGDTVDLQLAADPKANPKRNAPVLGDLRVAIANLQGQPAAVLYRWVSQVKKTRTYSSGVEKDYRVDYVDKMAGADVKVKTEKNKYVVEAALPLKELGIAPQAGLTLQGDLGVTHGDPAGMRTKLRTYWSNQQTGLVDDVVFELKPAPANWGKFRFE